MKNLTSIWIVLAVSLSLSLSGCSSSTPENVAPTCEITAPTDGAILDVYEDLIIKGNASDADGSIAKVILTVGGKEIAEVTTVPFEHKVKAADLQEGNLAISLKVEDNSGAVAQKNITVKIQDMSEAPTCKLNAPAHGATLNVYDDFVVKGSGEAVSGEISKVVLKIGNDVIGEVTTLPFEYTVKAEDYPVGALVINLEVENSRGRTAKDMIAITLEDQNIAPTCAISEPEENKEFEPEDVIVVKGTGADEDGTIARVTLKINDNEISGVTTVPFEYTIAEEYKTPGAINIALEVEDNHGKIATAQRTIIILGQMREFTDIRDGKVYKTVKLGTQEWFAENLAYLPSVNDGNDGSEDAGEENKPKYYVYNYYGTSVAEAKATKEYKEAGVLYNYWAVLDGQTSLAMEDRMKVPSGIKGICPEGWHVPSKGEWWILSQWCYDQIPDSEGVMYNDSSGTPTGDNSVRLIKNIMKRLKKRDSGWSQNSMWVDEFPDVNSAPTDEWGFGGFPAGSRYKDPSSVFYYYAGGSQTNLTFWTPEWNTQYPSNPGGGTISYGSKYEFSFGAGSEASRAHSIRCIKD